MSVLDWINHKLILLIFRNLRIYCKYCDNMVKVTWYDKKYDYQILCANHEKIDHHGTMLGRYRNIIGIKDNPYWVDKNE